jgi:hypothetical protein
LAAAGFNPWLDKKNLIGGELWDYKISKAIRESDFFLACLTNRSVSKRGFLQKEIRQALEVWQEKLDDDIYLIPVRFEDCSIPESLNKFQCVDLFSEAGLSSLLTAIYTGTERLNIPIKKESPSGKLTILTRKIRGINEAPPKLTIEIDYPFLEGLDGQGSQEINQSLYGFILNRIHRFKGGSIERLGAEYVSELNIKFDVPLLTHHFMSLRFSIYEYYLGDAHGMTYTQAFNYYLPYPALIHLRDLFKTDADYLEIISAYCINALRHQAAANGDEPANLFLDGASPKEDNFKAFNLTDHSLIITFEPYQIDCYAAGTKHVEIPYSAIWSHLRHGGILFALLQTLDVEQ